MKVYHTALRDTVQKLGSDPEKIFQFSDLLDELKAYGKYPLLMGVVLLPFVYSEPGDIENMEYYSECFTNGKIIPLHHTRGTAYVKAVTDIVDDAISSGFDH